jgi:hypothetical protein
MYICLNSGFRSDVEKMCAVLRYNVAYSGNSSLTFRDNLSAQSSRVKISKMFLPVAFRGHWKVQDDMI